MNKAMLQAQRIRRIFGGYGGIKFAIDTNNKLGDHREGTKVWLYTI